eukprot:4099345-Amphidinium_carterae.1
MIGCKGVFHTAALHAPHDAGHTEDDRAAFSIEVNQGIRMPPSLVSVLEKERSSLDHRPNFVNVFFSSKAFGEDLRFWGQIFPSPSLDTISGNMQTKRTKHPKGWWRIWL